VTLECVPRDSGIGADIFLNPFINNIAVRKNTAIVAMVLKFGLDFWYCGGELAWGLVSRVFLESQAEYREE
jgi:hypothetical protein